jgi:hypothetical protein
MLSIHCLNMRKTKFWQFGAIFKDKGTIEGIYSVHKSIFLDQLSLQVLKDPTKAEAVYNDFYNQL